MTHTPTSNAFATSFFVTAVLGGQTVGYYSLKTASDVYPALKKLPSTLKILAENLLRQGRQADLEALCSWSPHHKSQHEINFLPARVLMQDFTGVPAVVDLAAMRDALQKAGKNPLAVNPFFPVDLVIDHSVMVDAAGSPKAFKENVDLEFHRNAERYKFLKWGQSAFNNFRVVPPGTGICHQVNLEYLARVVWKDTAAVPVLVYPDTVVGTDSHTTMINGLGVLGWGVGGIEAEAAMLGQPISMLIPDVVGFKLEGSLKAGCTATDLVLTITQILRRHGVVGKFVEFFGPGLAHLSLADRATIANMAPEYGATCGYFPIDEETITYLRLSGREEDHIALVAAYAQEQGLWRDASTPDAEYSHVLTLDVSTVVPSLAGPKRPQDRLDLPDVAATMRTFISEQSTLQSTVAPVDRGCAVAGTDYALHHGDVVIAAITSCTNTSNPAVMMAAGLVAQKALARGLSVKPWVKTSLAPGSQVVTDYLNAAGLQGSLDSLSFNLVGYGCTTCIGNSGPLTLPILDAIEAGDLTVASVLSGNRNFEGRINPATKANFLASPPLVVAYALAGTTLINLATDALGTDAHGKPVYLADIWPSAQEVQDLVRRVVTPTLFRQRYADVFKGPEAWQALDVQPSATYPWDATSTYIKRAPYFDGVTITSDGAQPARTLLLLGDSITTDHISPAGSIKKDSPAGLYLTQHAIGAEDFNSYGARRGNHEVMVRGTFANGRLQNDMTPELRGGFTRHYPSGDTTTVFDASQRYQKAGVPLVVVAGKEYGTGSSRDWAAKGPKLLGVTAVIAESFERIHRSNLVGMGIVPLQFMAGMSRLSLNLTGEETWTFANLSVAVAAPAQQIEAHITSPDGRLQTISLLVRIDTLEEVGYYAHGGILPYVMERMA